MMSKKCPANLGYSKGISLTRELNTGLDQGGEGDVQGEEKREREGVAVYKQTFACANLEKRNVEGVVKRRKRALGSVISEDADSMMPQHVRMPPLPGTCNFLLLSFYVNVPLFRRPMSPPLSQRLLSILTSIIPGY